MARVWLSFEQQKELLQLHMELEKEKEVASERLHQKTDLDKPVALEQLRQQTERVKLELQSERLSLIRDGKLPNMSGPDASHSADGHLMCFQSLMLHGWG